MITIKTVLKNIFQPGGPAVTFALTNGNGTTANGTAVDLGGPLTKNTIIGGSASNFDLTLGQAGSEIGNVTILTTGATSISSTGASTSYLGVGGTTGSLGNGPRRFEVGPLGLTILGVSHSLNFADGGGMTLNIGSDANEDIYVRRGGFFTRIPVGSNGNVLTVTAGVVGWAAPSGGGGGWATSGSTTITTPTITGDWTLIGAQTLNKNGVNNSDIFKITTTHDVANSSDFAHTLSQSFVNFDGQRDAVYVFGYNPDQSITPTEASFTTRLESHYIGGGTDPAGDFEYHLQSTARNSAINRHFSMNIAKATGVSSSFWQMTGGMDWRFNNSAVSYMSIGSGGDLLVQGSQSRFRLLNTSYDAGLTFNAGTGDNNTYLINSSTVGAARFYIQSNLTVNGSGKDTYLYGVNFSATESTGSQQIFANPATGDFTFNNGSGGGYQYNWKQNATTIMKLDANRDFKILNKSYFGGAVTTTPTAKIHIAAGSSTANTAPLQFTSGTNETTARAGVMEYDGTNLFFTRTGTTRGTLIQSDAVNSVSPTAPNRTITVNIGGTTYYLAAKTTND